MQPIRSALTGAILLCSTTPALTQNPVPDDRLLELVSDTSAPANYTIYTQEIGKACKPAVKGAATVATMTHFNAGGMAYDPAIEAVWVSDGAVIRLQHLKSGLKLCEFKATLPSRGMVTGLAYNPTKKHLYQLEIGPLTTGQVFNVRTYDTSSCPPKALALSCKGVPINGTGATASGIAYDAARDLLYVSTSLAGLASWIHNIHVARPANPCTNVNTGRSIGVATCGGRFGGAITGLAYSMSSQRLYATMGNNTRILQLTAPTAGLVTDITASQFKNVCCGHGIGSQYGIAGTALLPDFEARSVGKSCVASSCGSCSSMQLRTEGGAPVAGNTELSFAVRNAPGGSNAVFYLSAGNCSTQGLSLPGLCGLIHPQVLGGMPLPIFATQASGTGCNGIAVLKTGVPASAVLLQQTMCMQTLIICPNNSGAGITNALQIRIGG